MFPELKTGIKGKAELTVAEKDTARIYGSGMVDVFATPAMIALMERAAHISVGKFLPEGYLTVGTEINIKHIKATRPGKKVWAESELKFVEGKKLNFGIIAFDEDGKIGFGEHTRYIVAEKDFLV